MQRLITSVCATRALSSHPLNKGGRTGLLQSGGNRLRVVADNSYDRNVPPISGDFSLFGGIYRDDGFTILFR